ncbi:MAG TPA: FtsX-like permease family protein [Bryobacteraceae bacterium]|nr:FtsX-like permease family protein [Bryobacteraceae bacterium]
MRTYTLLARNLAWYWRTNLAVLLGVATATGVLGGAALLGQSVRATLRGLVLDRLGNTGSIVTRSGFFREELAAALQPAVPVIALEGVVEDERSLSRDAAAQVYGVDERFWKFQALPGEPPRAHEIILTAALARELEARPGDEILLRVPKPSAIPLESLHGRKDEIGKTIRLTVARSAAPLHEFSLRPQQGDVRAVYVPLARLQRDLNQPGKVNTLLTRDRYSPSRESAKTRGLTTPSQGATVSRQSTPPRAAAWTEPSVPSGFRPVRALPLVVSTESPLTPPRASSSGSALDRLLKQRYTLADVGLRTRTLAKPACLSLESDSALIGDAVAAAAFSAAQSLGLRAEPLLTYLVNALRVRGREVPYSVVTALDSALAPAREDGVTLNDWAARELGARVGDAVTLEYYVWRSDARLHTDAAQFRVERVVPLAGDAADPDLAPQYPGITQSRSFRDWDPPFPLDLTRIRPSDEQYWDRYRTTPKAFVRLARGRRLWGTRFGGLTSIRVFPPSPAFAGALRAALDPSQAGLTAVPVRAESLKAAEGATDFGEYFVYFSFFLIVSALLLTGLFFKLGIEQRTREIGVLRSLGFSASKIRALFLLEGAVLAVAGSVAGVGAALAYGALVLLGLRTWWFDAVGTRLLSLHASVPSLAMGAAAGVVAGLGTVAWTLRGLHAVAPRGLLAGELESRPARWRWLTGSAVALLAAALAGAALSGAVGQAAGFFGAGALLLVAALLFQSAWLHARRPAAAGGLVALGLRGVRYRPGRAVLCIALIASAAFVIASLDAFRRDGASAGTGGFQLYANAELPLIHDPNSESGRSALNLPPLPGVRFVSFRLRPGDDASCLNLYQPRNPRILAAPPAFLRSAGFTFQGVDGHPPNPWLLLESKPASGAVPAIADANSMTYALHRKLGEEFEMAGVRYRIVAALQDSLFQSELIVSEENFLRLFPDSQGYRFFLLNTPPGQSGPVARTLAAALADYGFDPQPTGALLASYHKVENAYLSTFRALGALGLLLGTVGLAAVSMRNVLERRRELALLRAAGFRRRHLFTLVLAENAFLLLMGLSTGAACAALATAPAVSARGGHVPVTSLAALLALVAATGIASSAAATAVALRAPLLSALKSE